MDKTAVLIPVYYNKFSEKERCSLRQCLKVLSKHRIIFVIPENLRIENDLIMEGVSYEIVPKEWMSSLDAYSRMLCTAAFYERFQKYEYILIHQLDAFVFADKLEEFCSMGYDYIGAPWIDGIDIGNARVYVGNGGFSLRKVQSAINLLRVKEYDGIVEDVFWAKCASKQFRIPSVDIALKFAFERDVEKCYLMNGCQLPFGCHAWEKWDYSFWKPYFEKEGYRIKDIEENCEGRYRHWICWKLDKEILDNCVGFSKDREQTVYIWGAKADGFECGYLLRALGVFDFEYIDASPTLQGEKVWGRPVNMPDEVWAKEKSGLIIVASKRYEKEMIGILEKKGYDLASQVKCYSRIVREIEGYIQKKFFGREK